MATSPDPVTPEAGAHLWLKRLIIVAIFFALLRSVFFKLIFERPRLFTQIGLNALQMIQLTLRKCKFKLMQSSVKLFGSSSFFCLTL